MIIVFFGKGSTGVIFCLVRGVTGSVNGMAKGGFLSPSTLWAFSYWFCNTADAQAADINLGGHGDTVSQFFLYVTSISFGVNC